MSYQNINLEDFQSAVIEASKTQKIMVDFWADWCSPCHGLMPHLSRFIEALDGEIQLLKYEVDADENMKKAGEYKIRGFPTVIFFYQGMEVDRFHGMRSTDWINDWFHQALEKSSIYD